jgi:hypothetical protein
MNDLPLLIPVIEHFQLELYQVSPTLAILALLRSLAERIAGLLLLLSTVPTAKSIRHTSRTCSSWHLMPCNSKWTRGISTIGSLGHSCVLVLQEWVAASLLVGNSS